MGKSRVKKFNWGKMTITQKILHVIAVIASVITIVAMYAGAAYVVLIVFGVYGFFLKFRDTVLLQFGHWLFD